MKHKIAFFIVILFLLGTVNLQATSLVKVAYVDVSQVFDQFSETKKITNILNKEIEAKKKEIERKQKEIEKLEKELEGAIMLNEKEKARREAVIEQKKLDLQEFANEVKSSLLKKEQEQTQRIIGIIYEVIKDIAIKEGISMVVDKSVVLYGIEGINLTQDVIEILNKKKID